jgi:hypothetical protein
MSERYFVENGVVKSWDSSGIDSRVLTAEEFWENRESDEESYGLSLNGYGTFQLNVLIEDGTVYLRGSVR